MAMQKLVSTSRAANTGMHSDGTFAALPSDDCTFCCWLQFTDDSSVFNTLFAGDAGQYQVYTGAGTSSRALIARMDGSNATVGGSQATQDVWFFYYFHFGLNHNGTIDVELFRGSSSQGTVTSSGSSTEMTAAAFKLWLLGDDSVTANTDGGFVGEIFHPCFFEGIIALADLPYNSGAAEWEEMSATAAAACVFELRAETSDPGLDSSGNGNNFIVESSGVTLSSTDLPPGANPVGGSTGLLKYWTGSAWSEKPVKYWNGSAWVTKPVKYWNGSAWVLA